MNFSGIWINKQNGELIKLSGPNGSDYYELEYDYKGNDFQNSERIPIYLTFGQHALLDHSIKFGKRDIFILGPNRIRIGEEIFNRQISDKE